MLAGKQLFCSMKLVLVLLTFFLSVCGFAQTNGARPFVLGYTEEVYSQILGEKRLLNIYLPPEYDTTKTYQVIYLLDGGADEDFIHVAGLVQYFSFPWIADMPSSILVGIANTNRKRDFTYPTTVKNDLKLVPVNGGSDKFMDFIEKELMPFTRTNYPVNDTATLIGQSLGGLLAAEILFERPQLFDRYIIVSPSLWWDDGSLLRRKPALLQESFKLPTDVYIGVGKEGSIYETNSHIMEEDAGHLAEMLKNSRSGNIKVYFDYMPAENHATAGHPAIFNAFRLLYGFR